MSTLTVTVVGIPACMPCKMQEYELEKAGIPYKKNTIPIRDASAGVYPMTVIESDDGRRHEIEGVASGEKMIREIRENFP